LEPGEGPLYSGEIAIMAVDTFIVFDEGGSGMLPVKGETKDDFFKNGGQGGGANGAFEIKEFSFDIENPTTIGSATTGAGGGKAKFNDFSITKTTDKSSPAFFRNCVAGAHYTKVTLSMRKAGGAPAAAGKPFLIYRFGTVFTTKVSWKAGEDGPEEEITFAYGSLEVEYAPQDAQGQMAAGIPQGWSQITNTAYP
jgi:type VI secretion system secreted protein Hcp